MAEEVYKEEAKTVEELQAEIAALKQELADMKAQSQPADDVAASVVKAMEESTEDKDVKVEMLCRWAAARAGAIVIAPLVGTVALMANEVYLVSRIAKVYDVKLSERALIAFLGAVGSRVAGSLLTTIILSAPSRYLSPSASLTAWAASPSAGSRTACLPTWVPTST